MAQTNYHPQPPNLNQRIDINVGRVVYKEFMTRGTFKVNPADIDEYVKYLKAEPMLKGEALKSISGFDSKVACKIIDRPALDGSTHVFKSYEKHQLLAVSWDHHFSSLTYGALTIHVPENIRNKCSSGMLAALEDIARLSQEDFIAAPEFLGYYSTKAAKFRGTSTARSYAKLSVPCIVTVHYRGGGGCERVMLSLTSQGEFISFQWFGDNDYGSYQETLQNLLVRNAENHEAFFDLYNEYIQTGRMS